MILPEACEAGEPEITVTGFLQFCTGAVNFLHQNESAYHVSCKMIDSLGGFRGNDANKWTQAASINPFPGDAEPDGELC